MTRWPAFWRGVREGFIRYFAPWKWLAALRVDDEHRRLRRHVERLVHRDCTCGRVSSHFDHGLCPVHEEAFAHDSAAIRGDLERVLSDLAEAERKLSDR